MGGVAHIQRNVPELGITVLPFLWKDLKRQYDVLNGAPGKELDNVCLAPVFTTWVSWTTDSACFQQSQTHQRNRGPEGPEDPDPSDPCSYCFFKALGAAPRRLTGQAL